MPVRLWCAEAGETNMIIATTSANNGAAGIRWMFTRTHPINV